MNETGRTGRQGAVLLQPGARPPDRDPRRAGHRPGPDPGQVRRRRQRPQRAQVDPSLAGGGRLLPRTGRGRPSAGPAGTGRLPAVQLLGRPRRQISASRSSGPPTPSSPWSPWGWSDAVGVQLLAVLGGQTCGSTCATAATRRRPAIEALRLSAGATATSPHEYGVPVTLSACRASRSGVTSSAVSHSFVSIPYDEKACRPPVLITCVLLHSREAPLVTLTGLVELFATDAVVTEAVGDARSRTLPALDLTSPPAMRSLIAAALAADADRRGRPAGAAGHLHLPGGRAADRGLPLPGAARTRSPTTRPGRRCRTSGSARAPTRSAVGSPCCAGWPATSRAAAAEDHRRAGPQRAAAAGEGAGRPAPGAAGGGRGLRPRRAGRRRWSARRTSGSTWSSGAASSPSAAASSTSSRRPRSTRSGSTSSATPSRRSATSRSPTSAPSELTARPRSSPRRAASCCSPTRSRQRAVALSEQHPELIDMLDRIAQGHAVDGMEALSPALVDGMELLVDAAARRHPRAGLRSRAGPRPGDRPGRDQRGVPARVLGGGRRRRQGADRPGRVGVPAAGRRPRPPPWPGVWPGGRCRRSAPVRAATDGRGDPHRRRRDRRLPHRRLQPVGVESRTIAGHAQDTYRGETEAAVTEIGRRLADDWRVVLTAEGKGMTDRMAEVLTEHEYPVRGAGSARRGARRRDGDRGARASCRTGSSPTASSWPLFTAGDLSGQRTADKADPQDAGPAQEPRSTRWSSPPATRWCTTSTASAGTSRWCSAPSPARSGSTW